MNANNRFVARRAEAENPMNAPHLPVMLEEALAGLALRDGAIYVDGTFGRGGHSQAILQHIGSGQLHGFDQDPTAQETAATLATNFPNFKLHPSNFAELAAVASAENIHGKIAGILLDLGVSSPQLDNAERGFSFMRAGPLDMRMNPQAGVSAAQWLATAPESEIADVLWRLGEERNSRRIARRIVEARAIEPLLTTSQLADLIAACHVGPRQKIHPATRSFQAIRLHINRELDVLSAVLAQSVEVLAPGGRLAVISFHSLEDRIVKQFMRDQSTQPEVALPFDPPPPITVLGKPRRSTSRRDMPRRRGEAAPVARTPQAPTLKIIGRYFPSAEETEQNPRARSAVLRVAERLPDGSSEGAL